MKNYFIKTNRLFSPIRKYAWIFTLLVGIGGLWHPKIGLLVIPIMLSLATMSFFKGRYWCGNFCPHGSFFDSLLPFSKNKKIPKLFKSNILVIGFFVWFMFNLTRKFIRVSALIGTAGFWDRLGFIFVTSYLMVIIVGVILSYFVSSRTWCNFCPMGVIQRLSYKLGKFLGVAKRTDVKVSVTSTEKCHNCGKCARVCPMQLSPYTSFSDNNQFEEDACIKCSTCVLNCPANILNLKTEAEAYQLAEDDNMEGYKERRRIRAKVTEIKELRPNVREYTFSFIKPEIVNYCPGQYILFKIQDNPEMFRAFTISSYNKDGRTLGIIVKKVDDGYGSEIMFRHVAQGDVVELEGPMGNELIVDKKAPKLLFAANGIGITPFIPMVYDILENGSAAQDVTLIYGVRHEDDFIYDEYFSELADKHAQFNYLKVVSRPHGDKIRKGYVTNVVQEMQLKGYKAYICGSKAMTIDMLKILRSLDYKEDEICYEAV